MASGTIRTPCGAHSLAGRPSNPAGCTIQYWRKAASADLQAFRLHSASNGGSGPPEFAFQTGGERVRTMPMPCGTTRFQTGGRNPPASLSKVRHVAVATVSSGRSRIPLRHATTVFRTIPPCFSVRPLSSHTPRTGQNPGSNPRDPTLGSHMPHLHYGGWRAYSKPTPFPAPTGFQPVPGTLRVHHPNWYSESDSN